MLTVPDHRAIPLAEWPTRISERPQGETYEDPRDKVYKGYNLSWGKAHSKNCLDVTDNHIEPRP